MSAGVMLGAVLVGGAMVAGSNMGPAPRVAIPADVAPSVLPDLGVVPDDTPADVTAKRRAASHGIGTAVHRAQSAPRTAYRAPQSAPKHVAVSKVAPHVSGPVAGPVAPVSASDDLARRRAAAKADCLSFGGTWTEETGNCHKVTHYGPSKPPAQPESGVLAAGTLDGIGAGQ